MSRARSRWIERFAVWSRYYHAGYDAGWWPVHRAEVPVVSVGALTVGGAGKTPFTEWIVRRLGARGVRTAVVSRGYGRRSRHTMMVARGAGPEVPVEEAGDEPWLLARRNPIIVVVGGDRASAVQVAVGEGAEAIVLDDGFQHRRLYRDLDIVLVDGAPSFVLPFGPAREPPSALGRADLVVRYTLTPPEEGGEICAVVCPEPWLNVDRRPVEPPRRALLVSAIARPDRFAHTVRHRGVQVLGHVRWRDHRWLTSRDLRWAARQARALGADGLVTTEKDAVRWPSDSPPIPTWVLPIRAEVVRGADRLDAALVRATEGLGRC